MILVKPVLEILNYFEKLNTILQCIHWNFIWCQFSVQVNIQLFLFEMFTSCSLFVREFVYTNDWLCFTHSCLGDVFVHMNCFFYASFMYNLFCLYFFTFSCTTCSVSVC